MGRLIQIKIIQAIFEKTHYKHADCLVQVVLPTPRAYSLQVRSSLTAFATHLPVCVATALEGQPDMLRHLKNKCKFSQWWMEKSGPRVSKASSSSGTY
jgi:hypothetical protein